MSELNKIYDWHLGAEVYLCSDIDPKLDEMAKLKDTNKHLRDIVATYHCNNLKDVLLMAEIDPAYKEALRPYFEELARIFEVAK